MNAIETAENTISRFMLSWKAIVSLLFVSLFIAFIQLVFAEHAKEGAAKKLNNTVMSRNVTCSVASVSSKGAMRLSCAGPGVKTLNDSDLALTYLVKPKPLVCTLYRSAEPFCVYPK